MIPHEDARAIVLSHARPLGVETRDLSATLGRYLAQPVAAPFDVPRFDNSAMDGYGVRVADVAGASAQTPACLRLWGTVAAGDAGSGELPPGHAVKILTGAPVPRGVEAVVMKEECAEAEGQVAIRRGARPGDNIRRQGEEFRAGDPVLPQGTRVTPAVVGLLAGFGHACFAVHRQPRVALLVTGNELISPGEPLVPGGIYDANSYSLAAALQAMGLDGVAPVRVRDDPAALRAHLAAALESADVVLAAGGVSVGDYDFVKDVCAELGVVLHFTQVAIKPGKPLTFGTRAGDGEGETLVFGLPGNPVAALVTFRLFVRPALVRLMGAAGDDRLLLRAMLGAGHRKRPGRAEFVRGVAAMEEGRLVARPTTGQDSHMLGGLARANCLIHVPRDTAELPAGAEVEVELLGGGW